MKQEVTLIKQEVNQAILDYAEKHGVRLDDMTTSVEVIASRGDRELFATIALEPLIEAEQVEYSDAPLTKEIPDDDDDDADIDPETELFG